ncbi:hypothetical protein KFE25_000320 [Diacronema lutheri]|uniref:Uncharacterized protein n=1 Tax=Diacronema lutheri TaxID=2081491 RepID=A0A8J6CBX9_DIALT|nr:hypothetical protein KFE25_000320 [Diacronema lutheri]
MAVAAERWCAEELCALLSDGLGLERERDFYLAVVLLGSEAMSGDSAHAQCCVALEFTSCAGRALAEDAAELLRALARDDMACRLGGTLVSRVRVTNSMPIPSAAVAHVRELSRRWTEAIACDEAFGLQLGRRGEIATTAAC